MLALASGLSSLGGCQLTFLPAALQVLNHLPLSGVAVWTSARSSSSSSAPEPAAETISLKVNGRTVQVAKGASLLDATQLARVFVPTMCKHPRLPTTPGTCRLCLVEVEDRLRPACCTPAWEGAEVRTDTDQVQDAIRGALALLRANHPEDCMICDVNGKCEFQDLIQRYKAPKLPKLKDVSPDYLAHSSHWEPYDTSSMAIKLDRNKCIKCGRCVDMCGEVQGMHVLGFFERGRDRHLGFHYGGDMDLSKCIECGQCVSVCPVGALSERTEWREVMELLQGGRKVMVCQTAPAVRVAIGEEVGLAAGSVSTGQMVAALRALGFNYVFDTDFSADLTIMEEGFELLGRLKAAWGEEQQQRREQEQPGAGAASAPSGEHHAHAQGPLPMFTSCCPAWVNQVEKDYPELLPYLSTCKSPQQMMGAVVKEYWAKKAGVKVEDVVLVSVMPCVAKKHEADRPEMSSPAHDDALAATGAGSVTSSGQGVRHVDYVLTTRELGRLIRYLKVPLASLEPEQYDDPLGTGSGAAVLFGNSGGVMEAALRTVFEVVTQKGMPKLELDVVRGLAGVKEATVKLPLPAGGGEKEVRVAVASGIKNAKVLLDRIIAGQAHYDFVEVMSCPAGCIGGGGQPKTKDPTTIPRRMQAIYNLDGGMSLRKSHENPAIQELYRDFLGEPNGPLAHTLLHTSYTDRSRQVVPGYSHMERAAAQKAAAAAHPAADVPPATGPP